MNLSKDFYKKPITDIQEMLSQNSSFTTMGISDFGRTVFLKHLTSLPMKLNTGFVFVDVYDLPSYNRVELFKQILRQLGCEKNETTDEALLITECQTKLKELASKHDKIVIVFNRLDLVHFEFDKTFFDSLRAIRKVDSIKIIFVFGLCTSIHSFAAESMLGSDLPTYSSIYYLPLYSQKDITELSALYGITPPDPETMQKALNLSGGHFQLFQLLLKSKFQHNDPLSDDFIVLSLKNIYKQLTYKHKQIVNKVALGKPVEITDDYLLKTGFVKEEVGSYKLFTPLMSEYIRRFTKLKLSAKEIKLFKLLKNSLGEVVDRDKIFAEVWKDNEENATDWALDALAYRLRKNPGFANQGYVLENHKKIGYSLIKQ